MLVADRYRLDSAIGQGGMGKVWRGVDRVLDRAVAIKEMRMDGLDVEDSRIRRERTMREARATARIDHPNVVRVYDVVQEGDRLWIVMELVRSRSLEQVIAADGPRSVREAARIGLGLAAALREVHAVGVLHRDIKPGNVLLGPTGRVVLTDFGIAAMEDAQQLTAVGMLVGSPDYMAPERVGGRPQGPPSDLWSLGATLCAALAGRSPFSRATTLATLHAVLYEEPEIPEEAGPLAPVLAALLLKPPESRPTLEALAEALTPLATPLAGGPSPEAPAPQPRSDADDPGEPAPGPGEREGPAPPRDPDTTPLTPAREAPTGPGEPTAPTGPAASTTLTGPTGPAAPKPPAPDPTPTHPLRTQSPRQPRQPRRPRPLLTAALALTAAAAAAAAAVVLALTADDPSAPTPASTPEAGASRAPTVAGTARPPTPSPTPSSPPASASPSPPASTPPPTGASQAPGARNETGFSWAPPPGWTRSAKSPSNVHYHSPDGTKEIAASYALARGGDLLPQWENFERGSHDVPGYRRIRLERTTFRGGPAIVWEYAFLKDEQDATPWKGRQLGFNSGGKSYQINIWYETATEPLALRTYDLVTESFTPL
ncbi:protein kinase [Streptomyces sp. NPDC050504]|uniref:protein kinase domain-containing protein n=1 Tax=Streptomyces sp. NPDC050504 TaxID=3365618 RepID=UPI0037A7F0C4